MGCCNIACIEQEDSHENQVTVNENSSNVSFADLSIGSKNNNEEAINTEELNSTQCYRLRSISCKSLRYSTNIEAAFLMTTPLRAVSIVSKSCNLKSNETMLENTLNYASYLGTIN